MDHALSDGGWVRLHAPLIEDHDAMMRALLEELPLATVEVRLFGKVHPTPRLVSYHGEPGASYRYSGSTHAPRPFTERLAYLADAVSTASGARFNSVLVNYYRDGHDAMGAHADDEPELGPSPDDIRIGSLSLGARRRFVLRHRTRDERHEWSLGHGDLLVMGGTVQRHYRHQVPRTRKPVGPRLNLTFRVVRTSPA